MSAKYLVTIKKKWWTNEIVQIEEMPVVGLSMFGGIPEND